MENLCLTAARCAAAGVALHACAVAHEGVVATFPAGLALIALHLGLCARVNLNGGCGDSGSLHRLGHDRARLANRSSGKARDTHYLLREKLRWHTYLHGPSAAQSLNFAECQIQKLSGGAFQRLINLLVSEFRQ